MLVGISLVYRQGDHKAQVEKHSYPLPFSPIAEMSKKFDLKAWSNMLSKTDITLFRDLFWVLKKVKTL